MRTRITALGHWPTRVCVRALGVHSSKICDTERNTIVTVRVGAVRTGAPPRQESGGSTVSCKRREQGRPHVEMRCHKQRPFFSPDDSRSTVLKPHLSARARAPSSTILALKRGNANNDRTVSQLTPTCANSARLTAEAVTGIHFHTIRDARARMRRQVGSIMPPFAMRSTICAARAWATHGGAPKCNPTFLCLQAPCH